MNQTPPKIMILACSGIGKSLGTVGRMAAYQVTEEDRPQQTQRMPLALLVSEGENSGEGFAQNQIIAIDGCKLACATKVAQLRGGDRLIRSIAVLDVYRHHRELKPQGIAELNEDGEKLADALAKEVDAVVDEFSAHEEGARHA